jgi:peptide/nickel transport system permease protein
MSELTVALPARAGVSARARWWRTVSRSTSGTLGLCLAALLLLLVGASILRLLPLGALTQHPADALKPPSWRYWFGTDQFGRDILARTADATRLSFQVALLAIMLAALAGSAAGILAGYIGGWLDTIVLALADILFAFPAVLLALLVVTAVGSGWFNTALAVGFVYTPIFARVARGPVLTLRSREFVLAARLLGFSQARVLMRHILPNVLPAIVVQITLSLAWAILTESSLSFLGLGTQPPRASLGLMVSDATPLASLAWWTLVFPAALIVLAVLAINLLGDALRDVVDPTTYERR